MSQSYNQRKSNQDLTKDFCQSEILHSTNHSTQKEKIQNKDVNEQTNLNQKEEEEEDMIADQEQNYLKYIISQLEIKMLELIDKGICKEQEIKEQSDTQQFWIQQTQQLRIDNLTLKQLTEILTYFYDEDQEFEQKQNQFENDRETQYQELKDSLCKYVYKICEDKCRGDQQDGQQNEQESDLNSNSFYKTAMQQLNSNKLKLSTLKQEELKQFFTPGDTLIQLNQTLQSCNLQKNEKQQLPNFQDLLSIKLNEGQEGQDQKNIKRQLQGCQSLINSSKKQSLDQYQDNKQSRQENSIDQNRYSQGSTPNNQQEGFPVNHQVSNEDSLTENKMQQMNEFQEYINKQEIGSPQNQSQVYNYASLGLDFDQTYLDQSSSFINSVDYADHQKQERSKQEEVDPKYCISFGAIQSQSDSCQELKHLPHPSFGGEIQQLYLDEQTIIEAENESDEEEKQIQFYTQDNKNKNNESNVIITENADVEDDEDAEQTVQDINESNRSMHRMSLQISERKLSQTEPFFLKNHLQFSDNKQIGHLNNNHINSQRVSSIEQDKDGSYVYVVDESFNSYQSKQQDLKEANFFSGSQQQNYHEEGSVVTKGSFFNNTGEVKKYQMKNLISPKANLKSIGDKISLFNNSMPIKLNSTKNQTSKGLLSAKNSIQKNIATKYFSNQSQRSSIKSKHYEKLKSNNHITEENEPISPEKVPVQYQSKKKNDGSRFTFSPSQCQKDDKSLQSSQINKDKNGNLELTFEEDSNQEKNDMYNLNISEEFLSSNSQGFNNTLKQPGSEILIFDEYHHKQEDISNTSSFINGSESQQENMDEDEDVAIFRSQKNDIPHYINDKWLFLKRRYERKMILKGYQDCIDVKNNRDAFLGTDNTMLLTPSTSKRDLTAAIKTHQRQYQVEDGSQSTKKTAKMFDYLDLRNEYNQNNNNNNFENQSEIQSPKFDNIVNHPGQNNFFFQTNNSLKNFLNETGSACLSHSNSFSSSLKNSKKNFKYYMNDKVNLENSQKLTQKLDPSLIPQSLSEWLNKINLKQYVELLVEQGFDDLETMKQMMRTDLPINHSMLKKAGIRKPGHRARILVHLEWECGLFHENKFLLEELDKLKDGTKRRHPRYSAMRNSIHQQLNNSNSSEQKQSFLAKTPFSCCSDVGAQSLPSIIVQPQQVVPSLKEWLSDQRIDVLYQKFADTGFDELESLYLQTFSQLNPLNDEVLQKQVGIDKVGYRQKILIKLKNDSLSHIESLLNERDQIYDSNNERSSVINQNACECRIL